MALRRSKSKECRVCSYEQYIAQAAMEQDYKRKKHCYNIAAVKKDRVVKMCLRRTRWGQSFCSEEHFNTAKEWQQYERKFSIAAMEELKLRVDNLDVDIEEARSVYDFVIMKHLNDPHNEEILKYRKIWLNVKLSKARKIRELNDAVEFNALKGA